MAKTRSLLRTATFVLPALILIFPLFAQYRAGVQGAVTDINGAIVPEAAVTLTSNETNISRSAQTDNSGVYSITGLAPGKYTLTIEKTGFSKKVLDNILVGAEQMQSVNVQLDVGQVNQTVTVSAAVTPAIDTETAMISGTVTQKQIENLPSFGRDPFQLVRLAPGVFGDGSLSSGGGGNSLPGSNIGGAGATDSIFKTENGVQINANGARQNSNNLQVDGVGVNSTSWNGAAVITPNESSVKEVQVIANNYSAENGRNSGAQVLVVSQNGTNQFHGDGFFKWHRPGLDAYQRWNGPGTPSPVQKDNNRFNQFGGGIGGPIWKNKVFFFFSYETLRNNSISTGTNWYETPQFDQNAAAANSIAAKILGFPGEGVSSSNLIPYTCAQAGLASTQCHDTSGGLDLGSPLPASLGIGKQDSTYQGPGTPYGIGNGFDGIPDVAYYQTVSPNINTSQQFNGRLDYQITERDLATFSIYWVPISTQNYNGPIRSANLWNHQSLNQSWAALWNHTFAPTVLNEARFNASGWDWNEIDTNPQEPWGLPPANFDSMGTVSPQFLGAPGPSVFNQKTYNAKDTLTKVVGSHNIKFGADVSWSRFLDTAPWSARPSFNFRNLWDFANDAPYSESGNFDPLTGQPTSAAKNLSFNIIGVFVQDDWKVKPNLTLNLGLRWEDFTPLRERDGHLSNPILGVPGYELPALTIKQGGSLTSNNITNFGPQIGAAWQPGIFKNKQGVIRAGFGIGYNLQQLAVLSNGRNNPPQDVSLTLFDPNVFYIGGIPADVNQFNNWPANPAAVQSFGLNGLPTSGAPIDLTGFPRNNPTTVTYRYSVDAQYDLGHSWVASLGYQGSQTRHYTRQNNLNLTLFPNLNPMVRSLGWYTNDANANYNAFLAEIKHRFSDTFEIDAQYSRSRSQDAGSSDYYTDHFPFNLKYANGPSDFDVPNSFKLWGIWSPRIFKHGNWLERLADGWTISGIITAHSGFPWTPEYCNTGGNALYPNSSYQCLYPASYAGGALSNTSNNTFQYVSNFPKGALSYFTIPAYQNQVPSTPGLSRNTFRGPRYFGNDITLAKAFGLPGNKILGENARIVLQANFYNLFNVLNLQNPNNLTSDAGAANTIISNDGISGNPNFGLAPSGLAGRIIELQAKFSF